MSFLSYDDFKRIALEFMERSSSLGDSWIKFDSGEYGQLYLCKKMVLDTPVCKDSNFHSTSVSDTSEPEDPAAFKPSISYSEKITVEYNVLYNMCHSVPVLSFEAYNSSGKALSLEDIMKCVVSPHHSEQVHDRQYETITSMEHPIKGSHCYILHPCKTAELMAQIPSRQNVTEVTVSYLLTWLSVFGQVVGLKMDYNYF